ncbi:unnamed protein product [Chrysodeixis includens]|uniref:Peptidase S1 domain-containing protein n=1 Tax=Chrysodeixis includens TaxID=689277 RepID=A0A9P0FTH4_CHRIL|nr:unnamed protein product [Chrysodeixis includens]
MFILQTFWVIAVLKAVEGVKSISIVGNPLAHAGPCRGNSDVLARFESGLPPGEENQYNLNIVGHMYPQSRVELKFDSDATVNLSDPTKARISVNAHQNSLSVKFFKAAKNLNMQVKGPATGTVPYVVSIVQDGEEICENYTTGYFDNLILGAQGQAELSLSVPEGTCGRRKVIHTGLIVNGSPTKPGDWPWHVALFTVAGPVLKYVCGGTLLTKTLILTAAHCATIRNEPVVPNSLSVILGKHNLIGGDIASQEKEIFQVIIHPEYDVKTLNNDIALLRLKSEAVFDDYVQPACVWNTNNYKRLPVGDVYGTVVGWGFNHQDVLSTTLQQINIPLLSEAACLKSNPIFFSKKLDANKFCAGYTNGQLDPCFKM